LAPCSLKKKNSTHTRFEQLDANIMYFGLKETQCVLPGCIPSNTEIRRPLSADQTKIFPLDEPTNARIVDGIHRKIAKF